MALTGLQIFKKLPGGKKEKEANCKKCGFPTCMAFAMKLAKGQADISKCEHISYELKAMISEASQKQQELISIGVGKNQIKVGDETVMFRHEKTFVNPTAIAIRLSSDDMGFENKIESISNYQIERVGEEFNIPLIVLKDSNDGTFVEKADFVANKGFSLILGSDKEASIIEALEAVKDFKPAVCFDGEVEKIAEIAQKFDIPVIVSADNLDELSQKSQFLVDKKLNKILLNLYQDGKKSLIENLTHIRRAAIEDKFKPFGFPVISVLNSSDDIIEDSITASTLLTKYSNIIVLENFEPALISSLYTLRQNIYTDPQKPLQVESKLYSIGEADENAPLFVTTNFALTYFAVVSELEASGKPAHLLITPSDGMSVLTAWSASKFTGEIIAKAFKDNDLNNKINHRRMIICGYVASMKEEIEDELPDWIVEIGPSEAIDLVDYLKSYK